VIGNRIGDRLGSGIVAVATALVILGASIVPFTTPAWFRFEQDRTAVPALTGFAPDELAVVDAALLGDLLLWRGDFTVGIGGTPVLNDREREHMSNVRGVFAGFEVLVLLAVIALVVAARRASDSELRALAWRSVGRGARALAVGVAVAGVVALVAFDAAFEVFHRLFFSEGSYTFDPRTERLVQLFPQSLWSETAVTVGVVTLGAAILTAWLAGRRAGAAAGAGDRAPASASLTSEARP
jgi:integral membrane protein (TIGR01906 family)